MSQVLEINCPDELENHRLAWNALHQQTREASFFQTLDWLQSYWKHYGAEQRLRVLLVYSDDKPIGILPLCIRTERYRVGPLRVLTYPLHDWGTFYGPIGPNPTATLLAGLGHIRATRRDWDYVDLRWIDAERNDHGRTLNAMQQIGWRPMKDVWAQAASIDLSGSYDEYLATRTSKWRNNLRRHQRRLAELGEISFIRHRPAGAAHDDADPGWDLYDECERIASLSWQGSSPNGTTLSHESVRPFMRDAHERAARLGMVDLNLLQVDGKSVAFAYNYATQGRVEGIRVGYDPDFQRYGCGTILYMKILADSFQRGDHWYDLGIGSLDIKQPICTQVEDSFRYSHYPRRAVRAQALRLKRVASRWRSEASPTTATKKSG